MTRKPKGTWVAYGHRLEAFAQKARDVTAVVSDNDHHAMQQAYDHAMARYYWLDAGKNGRGSNVYFCWTLHKSTDGYFYSWREVHMKDKMTRSMMASRRTKMGAKKLAKQRHARFTKAEEK